jgi:hypothetical protein
MARVALLAKGIILDRNVAVSESADGHISSEAMGQASADQVRSSQWSDGVPEGTGPVPQPQVDPGRWIYHSPMSNGSGHTTGCGVGLGSRSP